MSPYYHCSRAERAADLAAGRAGRPARRPAVGAAGVQADARAARLPRRHGPPPSARASSATSCGRDRTIRARPCAGAWPSCAPSWTKSRRGGWWPTASAWPSTRRAPSWTCPPYGPRWAGSRHRRPARPQGRRGAVPGRVPGRPGAARLLPLSPVVRGRAGGLPRPARRHPAGAGGAAAGRARGRAGLRARVGVGRPAARSRARGRDARAGDRRPRARGAGPVRVVRAPAGLGGRAPLGGARRGAAGPGTRRPAGGRRAAHGGARAHRLAPGRPA